MTTRVPLHAFDPSGADDGDSARFDAASDTWVPFNGIQVVLLEADEDETDVPPGTPVGTIIFQKV